MKKLLFTICIAIFICGAVAADENSIALPNEISLKADGYEFSSDMSSMIAEGNVRIVRGDERVTADKASANLISGDIVATGNVKIIRSSDNMSADKVNANLTSGDVAASGNVQFKSTDRSLNGQNFIYNYNTQKGTALNVTGQAGALYFKGSEIRTEIGLIDVKKSTFTGCDRPKPHYRMTADEIILRPGKSLIARNASIYILGTRLFTIARYKKNLIKDSGSLMTLPSIGYDSAGYSIGYQFDLNQGPKTDSSLDVTLSSRFGIQGGLRYNQIDGRPYFARISIRDLAGGDAPRNTVVSRLPEVGIRLNSDPVMQKKPVSREMLTLDHHLLDPDADLSGKKHVNAISEFSLGRYIEKPSTNIDTERADARVLLSYDPLSRGSRLVFAPAVFARYSAYKDHGPYAVGGLKLTAGKRINSNLYLSAAYITYATSGGTPFDFDRVELKDELVGALHTSISGTKFSMTEIYDVKKGNIFDTILVVSRKLHCIESTITWRGRYRAISFDIKLAGR